MYHLQIKVILLDPESEIRVSSGQIFVRFMPQVATCHLVSSHDRKKRSGSLLSMFGFEIESVHPCQTWNMLGNQTGVELSLISCVCLSNARIADIHCYI